jgi:hypothetical protein
MIHALRHFSVRLWTSLLVGCLIVLIAFPLLGETLVLPAAFWAVLICFLVCFFVGGWFGNALGTRWVDRLTREAGIWERAGNFKQSETVFKKAVAIFDSFLISPLVRQEKSRQLSARMARFYLSKEHSDKTVDAFIMAYLHSYPDDEEVSDAWLQKTDLQELCLQEDVDLAFKLGEAQPDNISLQRVLVRACLLAERTDYPALKAYRRILQNPTPDDQEIIDEIAERFFKDRRADRWALTAFLLALKADRKRTWLLKGMAACLQRSAINDRTLRPYKEAEKIMSRLDKDTLIKLEQEFVAPSPAKDVPAAPPKKNYLKASGQSLVAASTAWLAAISNASISAGKSITTLFLRIKSSQHTRGVLKWTALGLAGAGLFMLMINTAVHLIPSKEAPPLEPVPEPAAEIVVTDPFTLQVAAYLKVEHADKYVAELKSLGQDAYYTEAKSTKSHWFQVRISHFPTKEAARIYGEELKAKGIIDDFYVANYEKQ